MIIHYTPHKLTRLARKYKLTLADVEEIYIRTLDDYQLLEKACCMLASGEDMEEVSLMIIRERK